MVIRLIVKNNLEIGRLLSTSLVQTPKSQTIDVHCPFVHHLNFFWGSVRHLSPLFEIRYRLNTVRVEWIKPSFGSYIAQKQGPFLVSHFSCSALVADFWNTSLNYIVGTYNTIFTEMRQKKNMKITSKKLTKLGQMKGNLDPIFIDWNFHINLKNISPVLIISPLQSVRCRPGRKWAC